MNKENLKSKIKSRMSELGADLSKFKFRYFKESPYQKRRFKPEFVEEECWVFNNKLSYVLTNESFENKEYSDEYLCMIIAEQKTKKN